MTTMASTVRRNAIWRSGERALFASRILILTLSVMLPPAFGADPSARDLVKGNPRLAKLQIEIWPEYDRPSAALVILRGEIAADVPLPAAVSLRIAATSGGPAAVAYSTGAGGNLFSLKYDRRDASDFITLKFHTPGRFIQIEFYDPLVISGPDRSYSYVWTGDLAAERLSMILQEPATASDLSVQPGLDATALGQDGLRYRSSELGAFQAGKRLDVKVRYTKTDPRTSVKIVKPESPESSPRPSAGPSEAELAIWLVGGIAVLGLGVWAAMMWRSRRKSVPAPQSSDAGFCRKCGVPAASGDRFCSGCGTQLA
jgi:hypothetical protein